MMAAGATDEEFSRLKLLVFRTLENNGVLGQIRSQIRHNVYKTIEQDEVLLQKPSLNEPNQAAVVVFDWLEKNGYSRTANLLQHESKTRPADEESVARAKSDLGISSFAEPSSSLLDGLLKLPSSSRGAAAAGAGGAVSPGDSGDVFGGHAGGATSSLSSGILGGLGARSQLEKKAPAAQAAGNSFNPPSRNEDAAEARGSGGDTGFAKSKFLADLPPLGKDLPPLGKVRELPPLGGTASGEEDGLLSDIDNKIAQLRLGGDVNKGSTLGGTLGGFGSSAVGPLDEAKPTSGGSGPSAGPASGVGDASGSKFTTLAAESHLLASKNKGGSPVEEEIVSEIEESISAGGMSEEYENDFVVESKSRVLDSLQQADFSVDSTELEKYDHLEEVGND
ncbi:unnamed protein product [Amoebophrya sp. A25]|nr:unnamed protein product [Amoebophrya sp. A25]|eukprot:GSA25T00004464001.1